MSATIGFIISMVGIAMIAGAVIYGQVRGSLDIKSKAVGDGQYGNQRWETAKEKNQTFQMMPFEPEKWRRGKHLPENMEGCTVLGFERQGGRIYAMIDTSDSHTMLVSPPGTGKTSCCAYPNMEAACACGFSFLYTDTKGTAFRDYAGIAKKHYGYRPYVIDFRNPTRSHGYNFMRLVNKYMDLYKDDGKLEYKARSERYAKISAKTVVRLKGFDGGGQNAYFYDAAEGLIASTILLVSEFCGKGERHIVSVFKIIQELLQVKSTQTKEERENKIKPKNEFQKLIELLPPDHKARWLAGAALFTADSSMHSVMSTAMSRLLSFIDSEMEQIICFDSEIDAETFCSEKVAVFVVFPEEDNTKAWGIKLDCPYELPENAAREVRYASEAELFQKVLETYHGDDFTQRVSSRESFSANHTRRQISDELLK